MVCVCCVVVVRTELKLHLLLLLLTSSCSPLFTCHLPALPLLLLSWRWWCSGCLPPCPSPLCSVLSSHSSLSPSLLPLWEHSPSLCGKRDKIPLLEKNSGKRKKRKVGEKMMIDGDICTWHFRKAITWNRWIWVMLRHREEGGGTTGKQGGLPATALTRQWNSFCMPCLVYLLCYACLYMDPCISCMPACLLSPPVSLSVSSHTVFSHYNNQLDSFFLCKAAALPFRFCSYFIPHLHFPLCHTCLYQHCSSLCACHLACSSVSTFGTFLLVLTLSIHTTSSALYY